MKNTKKTLFIRYPIDGNGYPIIASDLIIAFENKINLIIGDEYNIIITPFDDIRLLGNDKLIKLLKIDETNIGDLLET